MKYVFILIICSILLTDCSKKKTCWKCTHPPAGGNNCPTEKIVCSEDGKLPPDAYKDCQGNDVGGTCVQQ